MRRARCACRRTTSPTPPASTTDTGPRPQPPATRAPPAARGRGLASNLLHLEQRGGPGPPAGQAGGDRDAVTALDPAELERAARGVGDQLLGRLVPAHRRRLHAPHHLA